MEERSANDILVIFNVLDISGVYFFGFCRQSMERNNFTIPSLRFLVRRYGRFATLASSAVWWKQVWFGEAILLIYDNNDDD